VYHRERYTRSHTSQNSRVGVGVKRGGWGREARSRYGLRSTLRTAARPPRGRAVASYGYHDGYNTDHGKPLPYKIRSSGCGWWGFLIVVLVVQGLAPWPGLEHKLLHRLLRDHVHQTEAGALLTLEL
jgi:hypothetical protein